jgi:PadR family transcriptional regulator AphA
VTSPPLFKALKFVCWGLVAKDLYLYIIYHYDIVIIMPKDNNAKYVLLGLLSRNQMTGYDIKKAVQNRMSYFWDLSYGQIYPTLQQLEKQGQITRKTEISDHGPNRKIYTITDTGTKELQAWLTKPAKKEVHKYEFLLKLIFGDQSLPELNRKHIEEFKDRNSKIFQTMLAFEKSLKPIINQSESHFYVMLTITLGKSISKASVEWADNALKMLQEHQVGGENT